MNQKTQIFIGCKIVTHDIRYNLNVVFEEHLSLCVIIIDRAGIDVEGVEREVGGTDEG